MRPNVGAPERLGPYRVRTPRTSINTANRIHEDATAIRYGFRGGLVDGTLVYAQLTTPLVERLGEAWLDASVSELKLIRPAYFDEWLTVDGTALPPAGTAPPPAGTVLPPAATGPGWRMVVRNAPGEELVTMESRQPAPLPPLDARAGHTPAPPETPVRPADEDTVRVDGALRALRWSPSRSEQARWCELAGDALPIYREGAAPRMHPGLALQGANAVFSAHYRLEPWLHTASRIVQRAPLRLGDAIELHAVPVATWERKGNACVRLYVLFLNGGVPALEVEHSAIYRIALPRP